MMILWIADKNDKILIGEELTGPEQVEYVCNQCHCGPLVTINDKTGNSDLFCRRCGITYALEDDTVRHKSRLSVPLDEPALSTTPTIGADAVEIRHPPTLKDGAAQLAKRGTIRFTYYYDSSEH